jgi:AcrR family transcriptional regulator
MSPKQRRGEVTVERLMEAALQVYASEGEQGLTVSAVTKASGVSLGSLYHHFGSLDGLLTALAQRWLGRLLGDLVTALQDTRTARTGIRALVHGYIAFVQEHRAAALLLHSVRADQQGMTHGRELRDSQEARISAFTVWLQPHIDSGELAPLPQPLIESLVLGPVVAVVRRWLAGYDDVELEEAKRVLPERIWRSVSGEPR